MNKQIKPGFFGRQAAADKSRILFDILNEQLLSHNQKADIVFIGDSITEYWDLQLFFSEKGFIVNRGIGGDTTEYILKRSDADVFQLRPKKIVYLAGINDLLTISPDLWWRIPGADKDEVILNIEGNIEKFLRKCMKTEIFLCSVLPTDFCAPYNCFGIEKIIPVVNGKIRELCQKYNAHYVDYYGVLQDENALKIRAGLTFDGVHPNYQGYRIMSAILKKMI